MRDRFISELNKLNTELISMGSMCEEAITCILNEIEKGIFDEEIYNRVSKLEALTDTKEKELESACLKLIFSQQPVAKDLRLISAVLKMISDLERIADQALDIAELFKEFKDVTMLRHTDLKEMCMVTSSMVKDSVDSFVKRDTVLASEVLKRDSQVDELFARIKNEVIDLIIKSKGNEGESIVDILMMAKYLERIGDHSTNIAEWVNFAVNG